MNEQEWLGSDNQLGLDIWKNKYCDDGETFDHWLERISGGDSEVADLIKEKKFLFGGRILANRGLECEGKKITLSNCYVMTPPVKKAPVRPRAEKKVTAESILCPQCGEPLTFEGGCNTCKNCGWSKCS